MRKFLFPAAMMLAMAACSEDREPAAPAADAAAGKSIAEANCAGCHGLDGRGAAGDIPNLAAQPAQYLEEALRAYKEGRRNHAALQDLASGMSGQDIRNIAAYFSALPPVASMEVPPDPADDSSYQAGAQVALICFDCHGDKGYSTKPGIPSLAGQQPAYLIVSTQEYARGGRGHQEKEAMLQGLEQVDIEKMAMYFASQLPPERQAPPFGDPARGEPLSAACGECHGARGVSGDPLVPSLAGQEPHYLVKAIKAYRSQEREHDDMMADRSDADIEDIAAYYAVQTAVAAASPSMAMQELSAKCDRCHEAASGSMSMVVPSLKGQNRDYLIRVMKAYRDEDRGSSMMHKMSANYSDDTIEGIADWYAGRTVD
jgi:cytochrome c553